MSSSSSPGGLTFSDLASQIWNFACFLAGRGSSPPLLELVHLLLAFDQAGNSIAGTSAKIISDSLKAMPPDQRERLYKEAGAMESWEAHEHWKKSARPPLQIEYSPLAALVLSKAEQITREVGTSGTIRTRYLVAAFLLEAPSDGPFVSRLRSLGIEWEKLLEQFQSYALQTDPAQDNHPAWELVLSTAKAGETAAVQEQIPAQGEEPETLQKALPDVPIERLLAGPLSPSMQAVLHIARQLAGSPTQPIPISTSFLLYGLEDKGHTSPEGSAARWLTRYLDRLEGSKTERSAYLQRKGVRAVQEIDAQGKLAEPVLAGTATAYAAEAIERAREIASRSGFGEIHSSHLLAALLEDQPGRQRSGAQDRLLHSGADLDRMRRSFFIFARRLRGGAAPIWGQILIGSGEPIDQPADYVSDSATGRDLIGIQREVNAFARLIAARTVAPPLSIGLFGEWGSGKTFFMKKLRESVDILGGAAHESPKRQQQVPYYKRIVQIEFNAWHYVEGNLWASLVEHIFANLRFSGEETASEELRRHLIDRLGLEVKALEQASQEVSLAEREHQNVSNELEATRREMDQKRKQLAETYAERDLLKFVLPELSGPINQLMTDLGMQPLGDSAREMGTALAEARRVVEQGSLVLTPLVHAPDKKERWQALILRMVVLPLAATLIGLAPALLGKEAIAQITSVSTGLAALIGFGADWLKSQSQWMSGKLQEVEKVQKDYDQSMAAELADYTRRITELEQELQKLNTELQASLRRRDAAEQRVIEAQRKVREATVPNLLGSFIKDRAESDDYRKHLGLLALVREDFEKLSSLMEEENWRLAPSAIGDEHLPYKSAKYSDFEEEKSGEANRINRIVLYIDDLDRCPPNKVVEVLQAVHLLLAFPLFVVVVGVDARWIASSLRARYRELLHQEPQDFPFEGMPAMPANAPGFEMEIFGKATSKDYLEKIFQIPYWLRPLDSTKAMQMLEGILGPSMSGAGLPDSTKSGEAAQAGPPSPAGTGVPIPPADEGKGQEPAPETQPESKAQAQSAAQVSAKAHISADDLRLDLESEQGALEIMKITDAEIGQMKSLSPLLGRSPRALKRYVNAYRLIKARLSANELQAFLESYDPVSDFQVVLMLLAVDIGTPEAAPAFFKKLLQEDEPSTEEPEDEGPGQSISEHPPHDPGGPGDLALPRRDIAWLVDELDADVYLREMPDWQRLRDWLRVEKTLSSGEACPWLDVELGTLAAWVPVVARFSFQVYNHVDSQT